MRRLHMMTEEFNHYRVLADVLEFALGRPVTDADVEQMPEDRKLNDLRRSYMESEDPPLRAAMGLTEGGVRAPSASCRGSPAGRWRTGWHRPCPSAVREVSLQRVRMRYEQFNERMPWAEVEAILDENAPPR